MAKLNPEILKQAQEINEAIATATDGKSVAATIEALVTYLASTCLSLDPDGSKNLFVVVVNELTTSYLVGRKHQPTNNNKEND